MYVRRKPPMVEARQFTQESMHEVATWVDGRIEVWPDQNNDFANSNYVLRFSCYQNKERYPEPNRSISLGDWIVRGSHQVLETYSDEEFRENFSIEGTEVAEDTEIMPEEDRPKPKYGGEGRDVFLLNFINGESGITEFLKAFEACFVEIMRPKPTTEE